MKISFVPKFSGTGEIQEWKKVLRENITKSNTVVLLLMAFWMILLAVIFFLTSSLIYTPAIQATSNRPNSTPSTLRFVQIIFRHGRRTPVHLFTNDPNNRLWNGIGAGELTKEGRRDAYALGKWFRQRYDGFLSEAAGDGEVLLESNDCDRTLDSAQLFAAALFPPKSDEVWNDELGALWQPFPVHPTGDLACPRLEQFMEMLKKTQEEQRVQNENKDLIHRLSKGLEKSATILNVFDIIMIEKANNLKYPDWIASNIPQVEKLKEHYAQNVIKTPEIIKLNCGDLIRKMMYHLLNAAENNIGNLKVHAFSTHDVTVMCLMSTLNMYNSIWPPFSSALILELHENDNNSPYIKVLYGNETMGDPHVLSNQLCSSGLCPLEDFWNRTAPYFVEDLTKACAPMDSQEISWNQAELNEMFP